jgi:hypothetical protein
MSNAPGRVLTLLKQQAADLTHHHWAQVRWRDTSVQSGVHIAQSGNSYAMSCDYGLEWHECRTQRMAM